MWIGCIHISLHACTACMWMHGLLYPRTQALEGRGDRIDCPVSTYVLLACTCMYIMFSEKSRNQNIYSFGDSQFTSPVHADEIFNTVSFVKKNMFLRCCSSVHWLRIPQVWSLMYKYNIFIILLIGQLYPQTRSFWEACKQHTFSPSHLFQKNYLLATVPPAIVSVIP